MKIGFLVYNLDIKAGGGRYASDLINGFKKLSIEVIVLKEKPDDFGGIVVLERGWGIFRTAFKIRKYLKDCDVIHAVDGYPYGVIAAMANLTLRKKLIITGLGTYAVVPLYNWRTSLLLKWAYKMADKVIAISDFTKKEILSKVNLKNIEVINPGIDISKFYPASLEAKENFILSVGGVKDRKGYHISIPAFLKAAKQFPDLKYYIVGVAKDLKYKRGLEEIIGQENLDKIVFLDNISDDRLLELYQSAKLFILTPVNIEEHHFEGFGLVFLEAAATGLPVIGAFGNGDEDALREGINGYLVPQNDIDATASVLANILSNHELRNKMSQESLKWAAQHSENEVIQRYLQLYK